MIIKLDHIAKSSSNLEKDGIELESYGYKKVFLSTDLPNPGIKKNFMKEFSALHGSALFTKAGALPIELLDHGHNSGKQGYLRPTLNKNIPQGPIAVFTSKKSESIIFWKALGFIVDGNKIQFKSALPFTTPFDIDLLEKNHSLPMLDDLGFNCLAFICSDISKDSKELEKIGAEVHIEEKFVSNGKALKLVFARGPGGELIELIAPIQNKNKSKLGENMVEYDAKKEWTKTIVKQQDIAYPPEYIIRIFKGTYPNLDLDKKNFPGKKLCDVGFGDGRNFPLLQKCGFELSGVEITDDIVAVTKKHMAALGIEANLKTGKNDSIPFPDNYFDYLISWNACYYMGDNRDFNKYVSEFSRVMKKGATLVLSIPKKSCFIYKDSETLKPGYQIIRNDPFNVRNGEVLRMFQDELEIEKVFSKHFTEFVHGSIHDDCFGYAYHWHLVVCKKI